MIVIIKIIIEITITISKKLRFYVFLRDCYNLCVWIVRKTVFNGVYEKLDTIFVGVSARKTKLKP